MMSVLLRAKLVAGAIAALAIILLAMAAGPLLVAFSAIASSVACVIAISLIHRKPKGGKAEE